MTTLREAAQQALEVLEQDNPSGRTATITALRAALAEPCPCGDRPNNQCPGEWEPGCDLGSNPEYAKRVPLQEPVANNPDPYHLSRILHELAGSASMCWEHVDRAGVFQSTQATEFVAAAIAEIRQRMKDAPPQRKPLTEEELDALAMDEDGLPNSHLEFARAIERAHGIGEP